MSRKTVGLSSSARARPPLRRIAPSSAGPNDLFALFEWDDVERAREFVASYETHEAFEWVGAVEEIHAFVLEDVEDVEF